MDPDPEDRPVIAQIEYGGIEKFMNLTSESRTMEFAPKLEDSEQVYRVKF